jgi:hypothetical protein
MLPVTYVIFNSEVKYISYDEVLVIISFVALVLVKAQAVLI